MKSTNPVWKDELFRPSGETSSGTMTINGAIQKTSLLLMIVVLTGAFSWWQFAEGSSVPYLWIGLGGGLVFGLWTSFSPTKAPMTAPLYAGFQGLFLGYISAIYGQQYAGIPEQAFFLTMLTLGLMLLLYYTRIIRVTEKFRSIITMAIGGIALAYLFSFIGGMFGMDTSFLHGNGMMSIGISIFVIVIASLSLLMDFDNIERGAQSQAPKYMEWYCAFGLIVTLIWLYLEFLRLLSKLQSRD